MRFMIVDDDDAIRSMLADIIEDYDLGKVVCEAADGSGIDNYLLAVKDIDILLIDMLLPVLDGVQIVKSIKESFAGKIIMLSQVENKEMIGNAYTLGVDYYITKPINRNEVVSVIRTASEHIRLKKLIRSIESSLNIALQNTSESARKSAPPHHASSSQQNIIATGGILLSEMGISGEKGCRDLLDILKFLDAYEREHSDANDFPSLKSIFASISAVKIGTDREIDVQKECKALEQRLRRTIFQALVNLASMGIIDYANPKFEDYAAKFFDFAEVRKVMLALEHNEKPHMSKSHINIKKFIKVLFMESKKTK